MKRRCDSITSVAIVKFQVGREVHLFFRKCRRKQEMSISDTSESRAEGKEQDRIGNGSEYETTEATETTETTGTTGKAGSREQQYVRRTQELLEQVKVKNKLEFTVLKVEFVQEDGNYYLRVYCDNDREGGIGAEDLAQITRPLNKLLDKADFIPMAYTLEVCSPGFM